MSFFYTDKRDPGAPQVDPSRMNGTKAYLRHFENYLMLDFFAKTGTFAERQQALAEMKICERKLKYWERHPNSDQTLIRVGKERLIRDWKQVA